MDLQIMPTDNQDLIEIQNAVRIPAYCKICKKKSVFIQCVSPKDTYFCLNPQCFFRRDIESIKKEVGEI